MLIYGIKRQYDSGEIENQKARNMDYPKLFFKKYEGYETMKTIQEVNAEMLVSDAEIFTANIEKIKAIQDLRMKVVRMTEEHETLIWEYEWLQKIEQDVDPEALAGLFDEMSDNDKISFFKHIIKLSENLKDVIRLQLSNRCEFYEKLG